MSEKTRFSYSLLPYEHSNYYPLYELVPIMSNEDDMFDEPIVPYEDLNLYEAKIYDCLLNYVVDFDTRREQGYPIMVDQYPGYAMIVKQSLKNSDIGPISMNMEACARCRKMIPIEKLNKRIPGEKCLYHWGKFNYLHGYSCCNRYNSWDGCTRDNFHTWNGLHEGVNGPLPGFVSTPNLTKTPYGGRDGIFALDCEMCYTTGGLELARVSVVDWSGALVYDRLVYPENKLLDLNTRFSGITQNMYNSNEKKTLMEVQYDLTRFINSSSLIVGHGLENDLKALKLYHTNIIDTAISFNHYKGLPFRHSLKDLAEKFLNRDIRPDHYGHNSLDDARASMDLILWKVQNDFVVIEEDL